MTPRTRLACLCATLVVAACSDSGTPETRAHGAGGSGSEAAESPARPGAGSGGRSEAGESGDFHHSYVPAGGAGASTDGESDAGGAGNVGSAEQDGPGGQNDGGSFAGLAGDAGRGGDGDGPESVPAGASCLACGSAACGGTLQRCAQNPECAPWLSCVRSCDSQACIAACDTSHADLARVYYGIYACLCGSCESSCELAATCQKRCRDEDPLPVSSSAPASLAETGLYAAQGTTISAKVYAYDVRFPLWADGASKGRYIYVPACATIGTEDMDHWEFPVGTRLWKHFDVGDKLVETRLLHRYGSGPADWLYATYGWDPSSPADPDAARLVLHGAPNAAGTLHDIPDPSACPSCHGKLPEKPLGFSAFQLSHGGAGLTMQRLSDWGWLSVPARRGFAVPGTAVQQAALGYLHGNCGGCHNGSADIPRENPMRLRLLVAQTSFADTDLVRTAIGVPTVNSYAELHDKPRIDPRSRETSAIFLRMSDRNKFPMPPLASKFSDLDGGVAAVGALIDSLPK